MVRLVTFAMVSVFAVQASVAADRPAGAKEDKLAPDYVKCVKVAATDSLISRQKECHTNAEWRKRAEEGSRDARAAMERSASGSQPGSGN